MRVEVTLLVALFAVAPLAAVSQAPPAPPVCPGGKRTCPELDKWNRAHPRRAVPMNAAGAVVVNKPPGDQPKQERRDGAVVVNTPGQDQKTVREFRPATTTPATAPPPKKKK